MRIEHKVISQDEIWKYKVVNVGAVVEAQVWYNNDGTINEENTYTTNYLTPPPLPSSSKQAPAFQHFVQAQPPKSPKEDEDEDFDQDEEDFDEDEEDFDEDERDDYHEFTAYRVSGDGNALFPDKIIIEGDNMTYRKGRVIGYKETTIKRSAIGSVSLDKHLLFADIIIETKGGGVIKAHGFSRGDAQEIADLLE